LDTGRGNSVVDANRFADHVCEKTADGILPRPLFITPGNASLCFCSAKCRYWPLADAPVGRVAVAFGGRADIDSRALSATIRAMGFNKRKTADRRRKAGDQEAAARNRDGGALFDTRGATRHIETAYRIMADIARRKEKPRGFDVERT
jgi:hypothetical protein